MGREKPNKPRRERPQPGSQPELDEPRLVAAFDLVGHTGAKSMQLRYSDEEKPVVWMAIAEYERDGQPVYVCAADVNPTRASILLLEQLIDGGMCTHCHRPTGIEPDSLDTMPADELVCWYQWDPELKKFRRGCSGDVEKDRP